MKKTIKHHIHFVIRKNGEYQIKTVEYDFGTPQEKEAAGEILKTLKQKFQSTGGYSIQKLISETVIKEYEVPN